MIPSPRSGSPPIGLSLLLPGFDGTPYLATRIEPDLYHLLLLPRDWPLYSQLNVAFRQAEANRLPTHFLITPDSCLWLQPSGAVVPARAEPREVAVTFGKIQPCEALPVEVELVERYGALREYVRDGGERTIGCDPHRGGWSPSPEEMESYAAEVGRDGAPPGLDRCEECGEWCGACLDPASTLDPLVLPVSCRCENENECARCGEPFFERRLQSNWYDEADGELRYVSGFHALEHACPE
jgi:hypothetical protein